MPDSPKPKPEFGYIGIATTLKRQRLTVPVNQREYSWETEHVRDLFKDLSNAILGKPTFFLGTIVLTGGAHGIPEIADGQQRLATVSILLAAIRDYYVQHNQPLLATSIEQDFLFEIDRNTISTVPRLTLNLGDRDYFEARILSKPGDPKKNLQAIKQSHRLIENAAKLAEKHVAAIIAPHDDKTAITALEKLTSYLLNDATVVTIITDQSNAFRMFETLNDRGLKVSQADLVKNLLFGEAGDSKSDDIQHKWTQMTSILETLNEEDSVMDYFRCLVVAMHGHTRGYEVYDRIRDHITGPQQATEYATNLAMKANDYLAILSPDHAKWNTYAPSIKKCIQAISHLRVKAQRSIMLAVAIQFESAEAIKAFKLILSWSVRLLIVGGGRSGSIEENYARIAKNIWDGKIVDAKALAKTGLDIVPDDAIFETAFATATVGQPYLARYYLRSLEQQVLEDPEPEYIVNDDATKITLEHVIPKNPERPWGGMDIATANALTNRLGNLALLQATPNSLAGNADFADKVKVYKSGFEWTKKIATNTSWGATEITKRQSEMAKLALKTWPIEV